MPKRIEEHFGTGFSSTVRFSVTEDMIEAFATLTGDSSSLHVDEEFARRSIYRKPVAHGMLPVAFLALVPGLRAEGWVAKLVSVGGHFEAPAYAGDQLELNVEFARQGQTGSTLAFDYSVMNTLTQTEVTRGTLSLAYREEAQEPPSTAPSESGIAAMPTRAPEMRTLQLEDLSKGDSDGFEFTVTERTIASLLAILLTGLRERDQATKTVLTGGFDYQSLAAITLFSTLVGMRFPGELATFLEFSADVEGRIQVGGRYRLDGTVARVSRATKIVKTDVRVSAVDTDDEFFVTGKVVALANPPLHARRTIQDLKASAVEFGLAGKIVLVTGASRGIGETIAKLFALFGSKVVVNYRRGREDAERIVGEIRDEGGEAIAVQADVTELDQVRAMVREAIDHFGAVDVLVNNAVRDFRSIAYDDLDWDEIQADLDVTVKGAFHCCKAVTPFMLEKGGGKIVNISSVFADDPPPDQLKYVVSKAALESLTRGLSVEFAGRNIQVNTVVPSFVETEVASHIHDSLLKKRAKQSPMKRNATPEDVAHAVLFLASSFSSYTTGQRIMVTGGGAPYL